MDWISDQGFGPSSAITNNNYKQPPLEACQLQASCKHGGPDPASRLEKGKIVTLPETIMEVEPRPLEDQLSSTRGVCSASMIV